MARARSVQPPTVWRVRSVGVKTGDGPDRVAETYRILLGHRRCRPIGRDPTVMREEVPRKGGRCKSHCMPGCQRNARNVSRPLRARSRLDRLRDAVREGEFDAVAVLSPDRLARKYAYQVLLLEEFKRAGCAIIFVRRPISDDPNVSLAKLSDGNPAVFGRIDRR